MSSWILFPVCHIHNYHTFGIPAQPKSAKTLLCHRSPCRPGIPAPVSCVLRAPLLFPSGDRSAEELYKAEHPIPALLRSPMSFKIVSLCLSLSPWTQPSTSLQPFSRAHKGGDTAYGRDGGARWVFCLPRLPLPPSFSSSFAFLTCVIVRSLALSYLFPAQLPWPWSASHAQPFSATPERKGGMRAVGRSPGNCATGARRAL